MPTEQINSFAYYTGHLNVHGFSFFFFHFCGVLLNFKVIKNKFVNNDFLDSILHELQPALGKTACQRNSKLTLSEARI